GRGVLVEGVTVEGGRYGLEGEGGVYAQRRDVTNEVARKGFRDRGWSRLEEKPDEPGQQRGPAPAAPGNDHAAQAEKHYQAQQRPQDDDVALISPDPARVGLDDAQARGVRVVAGKYAGSVRRGGFGGRRGEHELIQVQGPVPFCGTTCGCARWRQEVCRERAGHRSQVVQRLRPNRPQREALAEVVGALPE